MISGGRQLRRRVRRLKRDLDSEVNEAVDDRLDATERRAKRRIVRQDAVATTKLYRSFVRDAIDTSVGGNAATRHTLTNEDPKAPFVEWGTGGFFNASGWGFDPPRQRFEAPSFSVRLIRAIQRWIRIKPGFYGDRNFKPREGAAIPIARVIAKGNEDRPPGTPPQPFMRPAWFVEKRKLKQDVENAMRRALRRV